MHMRKKIAHYTSSLHQVISSHNVDNSSANILE